MAKSDAQNFNPNNNLVMLSENDVNGCMEIACDGVMAHINTAATQELIHRLFYTIAATISAQQIMESSSMICAHQQVAIYVAPLVTTQSVCGLRDQED